MSTKTSDNEVKNSLTRLRFFLTLHRRMGVVSALFVILLSFSGLLLHYSPSLSLDNRFLSSAVLLRWYAIEVPEISSSYSSNSQRVSLIAERLYFNEIRVPGSFNKLIGMVDTEFGYAIATENQLVLISEQGELIEILGSLVGVPSGITRIGSDLAGELILDRSAELIVADLDALTWSASPHVDTAVQWNENSQPGAQLVASIRNDYASSQLSWERLILDIHSGRLLGSFLVIPRNY